MAGETNHVHRIREFVLALVQNPTRASASFKLAGYGAVNFRRRQRIAEVPFIFPSLVLVLAGQKSVFLGDREIVCSPGEFLALPPSTRCDVVNTPDGPKGYFLALYLYFNNRVVDRFRLLYRIDDPPGPDRPLVSLGKDDFLSHLIWHLLDISQPGTGRDVLLEHRVLEILLYLVNYGNASHLLLSMSPRWSERVHSLLLANPSREWLIKDVGDFLGVSESTLRRKLKREDTDFRTITDDVRMGLALSEVQFTALPISEIAGNCGYNSFSRFTSRFRQRFGATPSGLRKQMTGSG